MINIFAGKVYSKLATFPQGKYSAGCAEGKNNYNRKDNFVGTSCSKIYTAGTKKLERIKKL